MHKIINELIFFKKRHPGTPVEKNFANFMANFGGGNCNIQGQHYCCMHSGISGNRRIGTFVLPQGKEITKTLIYETLF